jgi:hypothetical protein
VRHVEGTFHCAVFSVATGWRATVQHALGDVTSLLEIFFNLKNYGWIRRGSPPLSFVQQAVVDVGMHSIREYIDEDAFETTVGVISLRLNCLSVPFLENRNILKIYVHYDPDEFFSFCVLCMNHAAAALLVKAMHFSDLKELMHVMSRLSSYPFAVSERSFNGDLFAGDDADEVLPAGEEDGGRVPCADTIAEIVSTATRLDVPAAAGVSTVTISFRNDSRLVVFVRSVDQFDCFFVVVDRTGTKTTLTVRLTELDDVLNLIVDLAEFASIGWVFGTDADYCFYSNDAVPIPENVSYLDWRSVAESDGDD